MTKEGSFDAGDQSRVTPFGKLLRKTKLDDVITSYSIHYTKLYDGTLIAKQTEDGVTWFIDNFLPILKRYENISITIAGRDPSKKLQMLCRKHDIITLVANPANMNNIIKEA